MAKPSGCYTAFSLAKDKAAALNCPIRQSSTRGRMKCISVASNAAPHIPVASRPQAGCSSLCHVDRHHPGCSTAWAASM